MSGVTVRVIRARRRTTVLVVLVGFLVAWGGFASTAVAAVRASDTGGRHVTRYALTYTLTSGGDARVAIDLDFDFGGNPGHGPTISIPVQQAITGDSAHVRSYPVSDITASSSTGAPAGVNTDTSNGWLTVKIGDASQGGISGVQSYHITYTIGYDWRRLQLVGVVGDGVDLVSAPRPGDSIVLRQRGVADLRAEQLGLRFRLLTGGEGDVAVRLDSAVASSADLLLASCTDSAVVHISDRCVFTGVAPGKYHNALEDARPNPASTAVEVTYQQLEDARAVLRVFDAGGREVLRPLDADLPGGRYSIRFFVGDLPAGVYFYSLDAGSYHQSRKMVVER